MGSSDQPFPPPAAPTTPADLADEPGVLHDDDPRLVSVDRMLFLVDQLIGLQAQLSQERHDHDRELIGLQAQLSQERHDHDRALNTALQQERQAVARVEEILSSRTWRLGQLWVRPASRLRRLLQRRL